MLDYFLHWGAIFCMVVGVATLILERDKDRAATWATMLFVIATIAILVRAL
jgi:hypothetical protein